MSGAALRGWLLPAVIVAGVLLHLPSLGAGFYADDHVYQLALAGDTPLEPWSLYDFGGTADWTDHPGAFWSVPWWTSPEWEIRFFRPLSSVLLWLDHSLFGASPIAFHASSLLWLALLLAAAHVLYRALGLGRGTAIAAVALLAASQATVYPADWIANRNSLIAATLTAAAVAAMASHARLGKGRALLAALVLAGLACLAKESGVVAFGALAAYLVVAVEGLPRPWARRAAATSAGLAVVFVVALAVAGFGTRSAFYATPWSDPARYASHLGLLATAGTLSMLTPVPSDLTFVVPGAAPVLVVSGVLLGAAVGCWAFRRLRGDRTAAFLAVWTAISLVPEAGAPTQDRLLLTATVGAGGLLAMLLAHTLPASAGRGRLERAAAWTLVVLALLEAVGTLGQSASTAQMAQTIRAQVTAADVGDAGLGRRKVIVLQADDPLIPFGMAATWAVSTGDRDVDFANLQTGRRGLRWTRVDDHTMDFESLDRPFVTDPFETVYRADDDAPPVGAVAQFRGLRVEVLRTDPAGGVRVVRFQFDESPDGPRFRFLVPREGRLTHVEPPAPGASIDLPEVPRAHPFMP